MTGAQKTDATCAHVQRGTGSAVTAQAIMRCAIVNSRLQRWLLQDVLRKSDETMLKDSFLPGNFRRPATPSQVRQPTGRGLAGGALTGTEVLVENVECSEMIEHYAKLRLFPTEVGGREIFQA